MCVCVSVGVRGKGPNCVTNAKHNSQFWDATFNCLLHWYDQHHSSTDATTFNTEWQCPKWDTQMKLVTWALSIGHSNVSELVYVPADLFVHTHIHTHTYTQNAIVAIVESHGIKHKKNWRLYCFALQQLWRPIGNGNAAIWSIDADERTSSSRSNSNDVSLYWTQIAIAPLLTDHANGRVKRTAQWAVFHLVYQYSGGDNSFNCSLYWTINQFVRLARNEWKWNEMKLN